MSLDNCMIIWFLVFLHKIILIFDEATSIINYVLIILSFTLLILFWISRRTLFCQYFGIIDNKYVSKKGLVSYSIDRALVRALIWLILLYNYYVVFTSDKLFEVRTSPIGFKASTREVCCLFKSKVHLRDMLRLIRCLLILRQREDKNKFVLDLVIFVDPKKCKKILWYDWLNAGHIQIGRNEYITKHVLDAVL